MNPPSPTLGLDPRIMSALLSNDRADGRRELNAL
jgi:hypothetical protein